MTRTIPLKIENEYIVGDGVFIGAAGSHNDVVLRMAFSPLWDGLAKTVQFLDALNENPVDIILTADKLEGTDPRVYLVPVPYGAKAYAGRMSVAIRGVAVSGDDETRATLAVYGEFDVSESRWNDEGQAEGDVTPTQAEQLQAQYEAIMENITDTKESAEIATTKAAAAKESAETAEQYKNLAAEFAEISVGATIAVHVRNTTLVFTTKEGVGAYEGNYTVEAPVGDDTVLYTAGLLMTDDVTVQQTPVTAVTNPAGGKTLIIGGQT